MRFGRYEFKPGLWPTLATLLAFPLLLNLGFWQLDRAGEKEAIQAMYDARYQAPLVRLNSEPGRGDGEDMAWRPVRLDGRYQPQSYLLDNQVRDQQPGYGIYSLLQLADTDDAVLVYRGWLAGGYDRSQLPEFDTPDGLRQLEGRALPPPGTGLMLGEHVIEAVGNSRFRVQRIDIDELRAHTGEALLPYVVRLQADSPDSFRVDEIVPGIGRERHLGYAFQWFALAATLLIIYFCVNFSKRND